MSARLTITGLQEAQAANNKLIAAMKPDNAFGRGIQYAVATVQRYAIALTHVDTGALRASHRMAIEPSGLRGTVSIDPSGRNPRTSARTAEYGVTEHERGGEHAFYERVITEYGDDIAQEAGRIILRGLP